MTPATPITAPSAPLEVWGGVECTVNRVRNTFYNQLEANGHDLRLGDLQLFAELGIRRLRCPILWELTAPNGIEQIDWRWADERVRALESLNVQPIVGLLHHGSGPRGTDLLDPDFPEAFARYAAAVARRFPQLDSYTPLNEPLTTARFSALYGHWYPHAKDTRSFLRALINQCRATVRSMQEIRAINGDAQLIQTDDLGKIYASPTLLYQAEFENERRWLGWDLLCGKVDRSHALWSYLIGNGVAADELGWFQEHPCPPAIIGINHYVTSNRYLSERCELFDPGTCGGNGRHRYADVEAVRVLNEGNAGVRELLTEAWQRYHLPLAITEAHIGCTREEQLRWLNDIWQDAHSARSGGADVRAVTVWSLLGSFNWNRLLMADTGHYEPGAFDVRGPRPRPTAIARLIKSWTGQQAAAPDPFLRVPGWWRRAERLFPNYASRRPSAVSVVSTAESLASAPHPLVITGANGTLAQAFAHACNRRGLPFRLCNRAELDICDCDSVIDSLDAIRPWAVINAAGFVNVDHAEQEQERCYRENSLGPTLLALLCAEREIPLLTFSSDLVFDGHAHSPYSESHPVAPVNVYGLCKARAEREIAKLYPGALIVRTAAFFGPWDSHNFLTVALDALASGKTFFAAADIVVSPTYVPDLVDASLDLLIDRERGLWHLANQGALSWADFAAAGARHTGVSTKKLQPVEWRRLQLKATRPAYTALTSERGLLLPTLEDALERYASATQRPRAAAVSYATTY